MITIELVYNSDLHSDIYNSLKEIFSNFNSYDVKYSSERKKSYKIKGAFSAKLDPFIGIYNDKSPIKGFYSEANECNIDNVINYLKILNMQVQVINISKNELPKYETENSAGVDIRADFSRITEDNPIKIFGKGYFNQSLNNPPAVHLHPGSRVLIPTGIFTKIPEGYEIQVRPRSGLALKKGLSVLNTPGTIDSDYINEIGVILINLGKDPVTIEDGERIAQFVLNKVERIEWRTVKELEKTTRTGGFGSTNLDENGNYKK